MNNTRPSDVYTLLRLDVLVDDLVDLALFLECCESAVDLLGQLAALGNADGILFVLEGLVEDDQTLVLRNERLSRLVVDDDCVDLALRKSQNRGSRKRRCRLWCPSARRWSRS